MNKQKGFRERIKAAQSLTEARMLLQEVNHHGSDRAIRRCHKAFNQLPFAKKVQS